MISTCNTPYASAFRLAVYNRRPELERFIICLHRVERKLRILFATGQVEQIGLRSSKSGVMLPDWDNSYSCDVVIRETPLRYDISSSFFSTLLIQILADNIFNLDSAIISQEEKAEYEKVHGFCSLKTYVLANHYLRLLEIPTGIDKGWNPPGQAVFSHADNVLQSANRQLLPTIIFYGREKAPSFFLTQKIFFDYILILPADYYYNLFLVGFQLVHEIPYTGKVPLYNEEKIVCNPESAVVLTDELAIPVISDSKRDYVFSSWYGGMDVAENLDFSVLTGHPVEILCFDRHDKKSNDEKIIRANTLATLAEQNNLSVKIRVLENVSWQSTPNLHQCFIGSYGNSQLLTTDKFREANHLAGAKAPQYHVFTLSELKQLDKPEFVIHPVVMTGYYMLIYGGTGVAKTWFALHLARSVSAGKNPFPCWELQSLPLNVLYIAGEMKPAIYGERLRLLDGDSTENGRFHFVQEDNIDICQQEDQKCIIDIIDREKTQMVIFDNLTTLSVNGYLEANFSKILKFFSSLQKRNIIVILIHHENRQGELKGTSKIMDVADQSIHLYSGEKNENIEILVQADKIRNVSKSDQQSFHVTFDLKQKKCTTRLLTKEEKNRLDEDDPLDTVGQNIGKKKKNRSLAWKFMTIDDRAIAVIGDILIGYCNDVIAANFAVRENVIESFRAEYGITEDAVTKYCRQIGEKIKAIDNLSVRIWEKIKGEANVQTALSEPLSPVREQSLEKGSSSGTLREEVR